METELITTSVTTITDWQNVLLYANIDHGYPPPKKGIKKGIVSPDDIHQVTRSNVDQNSCARFFSRSFSMKETCTFAILSYQACICQLYAIIFSEQRQRFGSSVFHQHTTSSPQTAIRSESTLSVNIVTPHVYATISQCSIGNTCVGLQVTTSMES